jgi:hypothetical protein
MLECNGLESMVKRRIVTGLLLGHPRRNRDEIITFSYHSKCVMQYQELDRALDVDFRFLHTAFKDLEEVAYGFEVKNAMLFKLVEYR